MRSFVVGLAFFALATPVAAQYTSAEIFNFSRYTITVRDNGSVKCVIRADDLYPCRFSLSSGQHRVEIIASNGVTLTNDVSVPSESASAAFRDCDFEGGCDEYDEEW